MPGFVRKGERSSGDAAYADHINGQASFSDAEDRERNDGSDVFSDDFSHEFSENMELNDFSDDMDLEALGDLLGGGFGSPSPSSSRQQRASGGLGDAWKHLLGAIAGKFRKKKGSPQDAGMFGEVNAFGATGSEEHAFEPKTAEESYDLGLDEMSYTSEFCPHTFDAAAAVQEPPDSGNVPPFGNVPAADESDDFVWDASSDTGVVSPDASFAADAASPVDVAAPEAAGDAAERLDGGIPAAEPLGSVPFAEAHTDKAAEKTKPKRRRTYSGILGAWQRSWRKFRRRLPSFKPKVYVIPEPTYVPQEKYVKKSTLAEEIERMAAERHDLGEVAQEYEEMRDYIRSVNTEAARLTPDDITPPANLQEVCDAQSELMAMIDQFSLQNEQQRSRIGVYEQRPEEDPYNYRGINDDRFSYDDMEQTSFSMESRLCFDSEQKIAPDRKQREQQYSSPGGQLDDDFDDDFDGSASPPDALAAFDDGSFFEQSAASSRGGRFHTAHGSSALQKETPTDGWNDDLLSEDAWFGDRQVASSQSAARRRFRRQ